MIHSDIPNQKSIWEIKSPFENEDPYMVLAKRSNSNKR
jgi:hypothetical protein